MLAALLIGPICVSGEINIDSYTHTVEMGTEDSFHEINTVVNEVEAFQNITLNLPPRTEKLHVFIDENECDYVLEEKKGYSVLTCTPPENSFSRHFISITYRTSYPVFELQDKIMYNSEYIPAYNTSKFDYILKLPVGYIIPDEKDASFFIHPKPKNIYSDGQRIILLWEQRNVDNDFEISVMMEPAHPSWSIFPLLTWSVVLIILLGAGYLYYTKMTRKQSAAAAVSYPALVEHEKVVVELLRKANVNVMWQKQIQVESGFSKVKLSRLLQSLEKRGVIRKEAWGNTNKIHLVTGLDKNTNETPEE
ncbi:MAG: hypothetical protein M8349_05995 [ANME-2 cluster archaeon]|nr:hypothetical protein [ANME-2 cluster archaeon]